jgi:hypothetical protein
LSENNIPGNKVPQNIINMFTKQKHKKSQKWLFLFCKKTNNNIKENADFTEELQKEFEKNPAFSSIIYMQKQNSYQST